MAYAEAYASCPKCRFNQPVKTDRRPNSIPRLKECSNCGYAVPSVLEQFLDINPLPSKKKNKPVYYWQQFIVAGYQSAETHTPQRKTTVILQEDPI